MRYERKFHVEQMTLAQVELLVKMHPRLFFKPYPARYINNIYYDSLNEDCYFDTEDGNANRHKIRIRWYGPLADKAATPTLEFKLKQGLVGGKHSYRLKPFTFEHAMTAQAIHRVIEASDLPPEVRMLMKSFEPRLVNRYHRHYFESADHLFRLTIDSALGFMPVCGHANTLPRALTANDSIILELKYESDIDADPSEITQHFPFRMRRFSKYTTGVDTVAS